MSTFLCAATSDEPVRILESHKLRSAIESRDFNQPVTMSLEAARKLSIPELLHALCEKLGTEHSRVRGIPLPLAVPVASLEPEVGIH